jgi:rubredoxin
MSDQQPGVACWVCPNCGQMYFGDTPPDLCDFCADFTTWKRVVCPKAHRRNEPHYSDETDDDQGTFQLPLFD